MDTDERTFETRKGRLHAKAVWGVNAAGLVEITGNRGATVASAFVPPVFSRSDAEENVGYALSLLVDDLQSYGYMGQDAREDERLECALLALLQGWKSATWPSSSCNPRATRRGSTG